MITDALPDFIRTLLADVAACGVDVTGLVMDHVGYQAASDGEYDALSVEFQAIGTRVSEAIVGGRRVGIYRLHTPLVYGTYTIDAIELVAPKPGQTPRSAFEHAEFVTGEPLTAFMARYPKVPWDTGAITQPVFPMLRLKVSPDTQVKFHERPVLDIVAENGNGL